MKSIGTQNMLWSLHGALVATLTSQCVPYRVVQPNEWRSGIFGIGGGRLTSAQAKGMAIETARREGIEVAGHDAAEAFCLLVYLAQHIKLWSLEDQHAA